MITFIKATRSCRWAVGLALVLDLLLHAALPVCRAEEPEPPKRQEIDAAAQPGLWQKAETALAEEDKRAAARLFYRFYSESSDSPKAEEALLSSARLYKDLAMEEKDPDWERVRDLYRMFFSTYPDAPAAAEAYFEVGKAYFHMRFFREALIYFKLFGQRYPGSDLADQARYWQAKAYFEVGQLDEAAAIFKEISKNKEQALRIKGLIGLGDTLFAKKEYHEAFIAFDRIMKKFPAYYRQDPELLIRLGYADFKLGKEEQGRKELFYYLNLVEKSPRSAEVLFALGESYHRQHEDAVAQQLYAKALAAGTAGERAVVLARFRQAQFLDDPNQKLPAWQKRGDLTNPAGDRPYIAVLDHYFDEPIAQDARYGLLLRYMARENYQDAFAVGKNYLRHVDAGGVERKAVETILGKILVRWAEDFLRQKDYARVYELYKNEYAYVSAYENGRLLYLVGQALQAMELYDQAAVVYYRSLALPLTEQEKADLYFRRAEVYIAGKDWQAADRLLRYLRGIYKGKSEINEVYYLSGRFAEARAQYDDALALYSKIEPDTAPPARRPVYAEARLGMLLALKKYDELFAALNRYQEQGDWLPEEALQAWYGRLGEVMEKRDDMQQAIAAYLMAVAEEMPQGTETAQKIHLDLGKIFFDRGEMASSRSHFEMAKAGASPLLSKLAEEQLNQLEIKGMLSDLQALGK